MNEKDLEDQTIKYIESISALDKEITEHYTESIIDLQKERRDMFKYMGTISAGAIALAPQIFEKVIQTFYFYAGIYSLSLSMLIAIISVLSRIENNTEQQRLELKSAKNDFKKLKESSINFLQGNDHSMTSWIKQHQEKMEVFKEVQKNIELKQKDKGGNFYKPMNYTSEFLIFSFILGLGFTVLSITNRHFSDWSITISALVIFIIINVMTTFSEIIFVWLGFPIDIVKGLLRKLKKS